MAIQTGINLSGVYSVGGGPSVLMATYQLLQSINDGGDVFREDTRPELIITRDDFAAILSLSKTWITAIRNIQSTKQTEIPDNPVVLNVSNTAPGINYSIQMGDLEQTIIWDSSAEVLTIEESPAFLISFHAYMYFVDSLHNLLYEIDHL